MSEIRAMTDTIAAAEAMRARARRFARVEIAPQLDMVRPRPEAVAEPPADNRLAGRVERFVLRRGKLA